jgi:hypothetical protein
MTEPHIQLLDDIGREFTRVATEHEARRGRSRLRGLAGTPRRAVAVTVAVGVLLMAGAYAVPPTRAAIDDITSSFAGWVAGDEGQAPGRALRPDDDAPDWLHVEGGRVIAETGGVKLYVVAGRRGQERELDFWLDEGIGFGDSVEGWRERFDEHAVVVLGPTLFGRQDPLDEKGRVPVLGVTARSVKRLELRYTEGPPLVATGVDGGFVILADAWRPLREMVAYDAAGHVLERADVSNLDMRYYCDKEPGTCPTP